MAGNSSSHKIAALVRRLPGLMKVAHHSYRLIQPKFSVGVVGVVFNDAGQVLLVEHVFHPRHPWGLPGGWIAGAEQPHETAIREIQEELSLTVEVQQLLISEATLPRHLDFAYLCHTSESVGTLSHELLGYGWFDPLDTPSLMIFHRRAINRALEVRAKQV